MVDQRIINTVHQYISLLPKELGLKRVFLFGSCAKGIETADSDIDVALVVDNMTDFFSTQRLLMKLRRNIDLRIEPYPIHRKDFSPLNPFAFEIEKTGIELTIR